MPRPDWRDFQHWADLAAVQACLDAGADPDERLTRTETTPLHHAVVFGSAETVAELAGRVRDLDPQDSQGHTPLWEAIRWGHTTQAAVLIAHGADAWRPVVAGRSAGRQALVTPMARLFDWLPEAVPLTTAERRAQEEADRLIESFRETAEGDGLGVAFVAGIDEEETIRRLGANPGLAFDADSGLSGTGRGEFDPRDHETAGRLVGVTAVEGGCLVVQPIGDVPSKPETVRRLGRGTVAFGVFDNPEGGVFIMLSRDDHVRGGEAGEPGPDDPPEAWLYRLGEVGGSAPLHARVLAYGSALTGVRVPDPAGITKSPHCWVEVPRWDHAG